MAMRDGTERVSRLSQSGLNRSRLCRHPARVAKNRERLQVQESLDVPWRLRECGLSWPIRRRYTVRRDRHRRLRHKGRKTFWKDLGVSLHRAHRLDSEGERLPPAARGNPPAYNRSCLKVAQHDRENCSLNLNDREKPHAIEEKTPLPDSYSTSPLAPATANIGKVNSSLTRLQFLPYLGLTWRFARSGQDETSALAPVKPHATSFCTGFGQEACAGARLVA